MHFKHCGFICARAEPRRSRSDYLTAREREREMPKIISTHFYDFDEIIYISEMTSAREFMMMAMVVLRVIALFSFLFLNCKMLSMVGHSDVLDSIVNRRCDLCVAFRFGILMILTKSFSSFGGIPTNSKMLKYCSVIVEFGTFSNFFPLSLCRFVFDSFFSQFHLRIKKCDRPNDFFFFSAPFKRKYLKK